MIKSELNINQNRSKRLVKNTIFLYFRMLLMIAVQFYTVPIVMRNLGISDYGLYNVIGGMVTMFSFLGGTLASGTQRYISYALGKKDTELLSRTFHTTCTLYIVIALILLLLIESFGLWFISYKMVIPDDRHFASLMIFHFSVISFILNLLSIPYSSTLIAHEQMNVYAYSSIFECIAKLLLAVSLPFISSDKLIYYGFFLLIIAIIMRIYYQIYCYRHFYECRSLKIIWDKNLSKKLIIYSSWNIFGVLACISKNQGINILLNLFFGTVLNAAYAVASQINGVLNQLVTNIYMSSRPQITKYFAEGNSKMMWRIVFTSTKISYYLLLIVCLPLLIELNTILKMWLNDVPLHTVFICRLLIIILLLETTINQLIGVFQASEKIRMFQLTSSTVSLLCLPIIYVLLRFFNSSIETPFFTTAIISVFYCITTLIISKKELQLEIFTYLNKVILPILYVSSLLVIIALFYYKYTSPSMLRVLITMFSSLLISPFVIYILGIDKDEKIFIIAMLKKFYEKVSIKQKRV